MKNVRRNLVLIGLLVFLSVLYVNANEFGAPVIISPGDQTNNEGDTVSLQIIAYDLPEGELNYSNSSMPPNLTTNTTGFISGTLDFNSAGIYSTTVTVTNATGSVNSTTFSWTVINVNRAPVLAFIGNKTGNELSLLEFTISATDADSDPLTYSATGLPAGATFTPSNKTFSWTPNSTQSGTYPVQFQVNDSNLTDSEDVTITVGNVNQAPVLDPIGSKTVNELSLLEFTISANDSDGDSLTYSATGLPAGATFDPANRTFSWTPGLNQQGDHIVTFQVNDSNLTDSEDVTITVGNVNQAPVLDPIGSKTVNELSLLEFTISANDSDGDSLTYSATGLPAGAIFGSSKQDIQLDTGS